MKQMLLLNPKMFLPQLIIGGSCVEDTGNPAAYDSVLVPTVLGYHLANHPYSLAHMQQAYTNLYGSSTGISITNKYVRFKPSAPEQLSVLEDLDIDLFDHPLDYDMVQEGDYYDDGVTPAEEIPWLYAVVDASFNPPAGITYEVLEQVHIPTLAAVENEAFRITGNPVDDPNCSPIIEELISPGVAEPSVGKITPDNAIDCPPGYYWDAIDRTCVPETSGPPPPSPTRQPSGTITVEDNVLHTLRGVRVARVVAKRFLKIERTYTDNQGHFYLSKEFNKVRLIAKFKNSQAIIRGLRRSRLWQILYAAERDFGTHKGPLNNLQLTIPFNTNALSRSARYWAAATAHNTVQEYYEYAAQNNIGTPPGGIRILLSNWHNASGATPMYAKRVIQELPEDFLRFYVLGSAIYDPVVANLAYTLKREIDVTVGYNRFSAFNNADITRDADDVSEIMFHELTHAAHYNKVGNNWWNDFVDGELNNIIWHSDDNPPYGFGNQGYTSDIIGMGESWAYHMGHIMTDMKYGVNSNCASEQANRSGFRLTQFCPTGANHPQN